MFVSLHMSCFVYVCVCCVQLGLMSFLRKKKRKKPVTIFDVPVFACVSYLSYFCPFHLWKQLIGFMNPGINFCHCWSPRYHTL